MWGRSKGVLLAAAMLACTCAQAGEFTVAGRKVTTVVPEGLCAVTAEPRDAKIRDAIISGTAPGLQVLEAFVQCSALDTLRKGDFSVSATLGTTSVVLNGGKVVPAKQTREQLRLSFAGGAAERHQARLKADAWLSQAHVGPGPQSFEVVDVDGAGVYSVTGVGTRSAAGKRMLNTQGVTIVDSIPLAITVTEIAATRGLPWPARWTAANAPWPPSLRRIFRKPQPCWSLPDTSAPGELGSRLVDVLTLMALGH